MAQQPCPNISEAQVGLSELPQLVMVLDQHLDIQTSMSGLGAAEGPSKRQLDTWGVTVHRHKPSQG